ncbi:MAG: Ldh family oxidoreductase [Pseudomonadota bacterium]
MVDETTILQLDEVRTLAQSVLRKAGMDPNGSDILAELIMKSERDGPRSHGLRILPAYQQSFASGYANPKASPRIKQTGPAVLKADADNGYYQVALAGARDDLIRLARQTGVAAFSCSNCHHLAALRFDTEPFADAGLIALSCINSLSMVVPHGGTTPVFGTNPMSFACPRADGPPIVWDQASSVVALMDVRLAAAENQELSMAGGLDRDGAPTADPNAILETKKLLPFGEHKGGAIAFMIEVLGAALSGGTLSVDNEAREAHDALNIKGGATLIVIDPASFGNPSFHANISQICAEIDGNGTARVPGDGRLKRRADSTENGVSVDLTLLSELRSLAT